MTNKSSIKEALVHYDTGTWGVDLEICFKEDNFLEGDSFNDQAEEQLDTVENGPKKTLPTEDIKMQNSMPAEEPDEVIIYEWDLEVLDKIFSEKEEGKSIMHGLHSMWLVYFSKLIAKQDNEIKKLGQNVGKRSSVILNGKKIKLIRLGSIRHTQL